eukprot:s385_g5.t1
MPEGDGTAGGQVMGSSNLPWHLIPKFVPGETDVNEYTRRLEFLANLWPKEHLSQLAPRACLLCEGTAFSKVVRLDPEKLKTADTEGVKLLVKTLGGTWGQTKLETKYERFERALYGTVQKQDETHTSYLARHEVQFEELANMGATLSEFRAYILIRNSGLTSEDKKRIIVESAGNLKYSKVTDSIKLLASKFFGEVQAGTNAKANPRNKTYDVNFVDDEHWSDEADESAFLSVEAAEDLGLETLLSEGDEDALLVQQFEDSLIDSLQSDSEVATCLNTYLEARKRITEKVKGRGFWSAKPSKGFAKGRGKHKGRWWLSDESKFFHSIRRKKSEHEDQTCRNPLSRKTAASLPDSSQEVVTFASHGTHGIVDLGASMSVIGESQFQQLCKHLPVTVKHAMKEAPCNVSFRFGNDSIVVGRRAVFFPVGDKWIKVVIVPSNTPFLIANSVFRSLGALIDVASSCIRFQSLEKTVPMHLTDRKLFRIDLLDLLQNEHQPPTEAVMLMNQIPEVHEVQQVVEAKAGSISALTNRVTCCFLPVTMPQGSNEVKFDDLADRLRRLSIAEKEAAEDLSPIMAMTLTELMEERVAFGKAHTGKAFKDLIPETKYLSWFAENYKASRKPEHVKLLRFIQLHVEDLGGQKPTKKMIQAKAKAKCPPGHPQMTIDLEEDEDEVWDAIPEGPSLEVMQMHDRMNQLENTLREVLGHLTQQAQQQPSA